MSDLIESFQDYIKGNIPLKRLLFVVVAFIVLWIIAAALSGMVENLTVRGAEILWSQLKQQVSCGWALLFSFVLMTVTFVMGIAFTKRFGQISPTSVNKTKPMLITDGYIAESNLISQGEIFAKLYQLRNGTIGINDFQIFMLEGLNAKKISLENAKHFLDEVGLGVKFSNGTYTVYQKRKV